MLRVTQKMYADACAVGPKAAYMHLQQIDPELVTTSSVRKFYPLHAVLGCALPRKYYFAGAELLRLSVDDGSPHYGPKNPDSDGGLEAFLTSIPGGEARIAKVRREFMNAIQRALRGSAVLFNLEELRQQLLRLDFVIEFVMTGDEAVLPQTQDQYHFESLRFAILHSDELEIDEEIEAFA